MNLFTGRCNNNELMGDKIQELVWRFNHAKDKSDRFPNFIKILSITYDCHDE